MAIDVVSIEIKRKAGTEDIPLPQYMSDHASGMDVRAAVEESVTIPPGGIRLIPTGLTIAVPPGYEAQVRPRSGLALKQGVGLPNAPGTLDSDYRGEVQVLLINHSPRPFRIERGDRIAQLVVAPVERVEVVEIEAVDGTPRGDGGFGSTGRR